MERRADLGEEEAPQEGTQPQPTPPPKARRRKRPLWRELPVLIVIAFAAALLIKTFAVQAFVIPSPSMSPTLTEDDRVLVEKITYRFGGPSRGDVVVFERDVSALQDPTPEPDDDSVLGDIADAFRGLFGFHTGDSQDFIKRVIAVGGDTVEGRNGEVLVNGEPVEEPYLPEGTTTSPFRAWEVSEGEIFVMGDNRSNSDDSRRFGPVPVDSVVGRAVLLVWPPSDLSTL